MSIEVRTLGGLRIAVNGTEAEDLAGGGLRAALLVFLAVERTATRDQAIGLLWPEREGDRARHSLSQALYELKGRLGEGWVLRRGDRLRAADEVECDAASFATAAESGSPSEALALYRGPFLKGTYLWDTAPFEQWVDGWRGRLAALHRRFCREAVARNLARGNRAAAIAAARRLAEEAPFDTGAQRALIELLAERGDRRGALRQYERFERRLRTEGMTPPSSMAAVVDRLRPTAEEADDELSYPTPALPRTVGDSPIPRLVVLPFEHLGQREEELFTEGLTDEITSRLVRLRELGIIARTSANRYRNTSKGIAQIRRELGVDYVLEGTVRWDVSGGEKRVRVSPQLIRASDATHLWAETYEATLDDLFSVQNRIAERVADALDLRLGESERRSLTRFHPGDADAFQLCVRGRRRWEESVPGALREAAALFQKAIELDPTYARAYAGLAAAYVLLPSFSVTASAGWYGKAKMASDRAIELDPSCADAHLAAGLIAYLLDWDMPAAERHLRRALEIAASDARAHVFLAHVECVTGRTSQAFETMARAQALDPLSVNTNFNVAFQAWQGRARDLAVRQLRLVTQLAPDFEPACYVLGGIHYLEDDLSAARREWAPIGMFGPTWQSLLDALEQPAEAIGILDRIVDLAPGAVHWYGAASLYALLGASDRAFRVLESHYQNVRGEPAEMATAGPGLVHVVTDPFFDRLRSDPRHDDLLRRIGLG